MEAATALQVASGPTLKVKEVSPGDAEEPQTSPRQGAGSPIPQLLSPVEGDCGGGECGELDGGNWEDSCTGPLLRRLVQSCEVSRFRGVGSEGAEILLGAPLRSWVELSLLLKCLCWVFAF